jgi:glycosyltransferase involved in cell wall biosynthesis
MRIARVLTRMNLGGPARQVLASDPRLARRGHTLRVFAGTPEPGEGDLFETARARGIDVVRVPALGRALSVRRDVRAHGFLVEALRAFAPQVIHTHASKAGALGRLAARSLENVPVVHTFHGQVLEDVFPPPLALGFTVCERELARDTRRVIAVSRATADVLLRKQVVDSERLTVVPPGVELDALLSIEGRSGALRTPLALSRGALLVGVIGRLAEVKRPEWAVDVFAQLADTHGHLHLVFLGDGARRALLEQRIAQLDGDARQRVHVVGAVHDMAPVLADLDVVLHTSRSEGLPVALIEAGAAGLPVVATPVAGTPELVEDGESGHLARTPLELAQRLARLVGDAAERRRLGRRARAIAAARHGPEELADRLEAVYAACA